MTKIDVINSGFNLGNELDYMLDRSYTAASRLNYQFYLWKDTLRFNLHPSIQLPKDESTPVRIADLALGPPPRSCSGTVQVHPTGWL